MLDNLFAKNFIIAFILVAFLEAASFLAHQFTWLNIILFGLICAVTAVLSIRRLEYGLYILLAELFIGSKGQLFFLEIDDNRFSIRMGLFTVIFLIWLFNLGRGKSLEFFKSKWLGYYLALFIFIALGIINGLLNSQFSNLFFDANGWLYFLILPVFFAAIFNQQVIKNIFTILMASVLWLSVKTIVVAFLFSHQISRLGDIFYQWLRDSGVGEITFITDNFYRVFFQAHLYVMFGLLFALAWLILRKNSKKERIILIFMSVLSSAAILISSSRSFWLGLLAGLLMLFLLLFFKYKYSLKKILKPLALIVLIGLVEITLLSAAFKGFGDSLLGNRFELSQEASSVSRLQQLKPLSEEIFKKPILGSGFGQQVTYVSNDPRIRAEFPDGRYTTSAFEWGYLDIWLKIGLLGLLAYLILIVKIARESLKAGLLGEILFIALTALVITHTFSPYLNHPLGIGFILLSTALVYFLNHEQRPA